MFQIFPTTDFRHCLTLRNVWIQIGAAIDILKGILSVPVVNLSRPAHRQAMLIVILFQRTPSFLFGIAFFALLLVCAESVPPTVRAQTPRAQTAFAQLALAQTAAPELVPSQSTASTSTPLSSESGESTEDQTVDRTEDRTVPQTVEQKVQRYHELIAEMREQVRLITEAKLNYYLDGLDQSYDWKDQWELGIASVVKLRGEFETLATDLFINHGDDPQAPESLAVTMSVVLVKMLKQDRHQETVAVIEGLRKIKPDSEQLKFDLALTMLKTNQFAQANRLIDSIPPAKLETLDGNDNDLLPLRIQLESMYEKEQEILLSESDDDLPRVELLTTAGPVIVELFENQAPDTVGNFIQLVESDFYTDVVFHRVISGFMAQTGLIAKAGDYWAGKGVDYTIYDETENGRSHFSGYLSMAKTDQPNSGNTQFFITFQPTVSLNGRHTVFGRVIQGMDAVGRLQPTFVIKTEKDKPPKEIPIESVTPDRILSATVIRKRDHEYRPNKVDSN